MMKKIVLSLLMLCLCGSLLTGMEVSAEAQYVYDQADLLTEAEEQELQARAQAMKESWEMNFMVVTTDNAEGKSSMEYADDFYDAHFLEEDGMLYLLDMDNREIYLSTAGLAIRYLTDTRIESVLDEAYEYVVDGDYCGTFNAFFDATEGYLVEGIREGQYNYDTETGEIDYYNDPEADEAYEDLSSPMRIDIIEFFFGLFGAFIPASIWVLIVKLTYRKRKYKELEYDAYTDAEIQLTVETERLINKVVTKRRVERDDDDDRSSVHSSSSGSSHGGGGRSF